MKVRSVGAVLSLVIVAIPGVAADYNDSTGFSFTYPDGWVAVTKPGKDIDEKTIPPEINNWLKKNNVDLNKLCVALIRDGKDEFLENLNVVVTDQEIPVNDASMKKLIDTLSEQYRGMGAIIDNLDGRIQKLGTNQAVVIDVQPRLPSVPFPIRQRQVFFPGGGKTYIVTCTASVHTFAEHSPTFDAVLASFKVPAPSTKGFDMNRILIMAIVGGAVGGLIALFKKLTGKKSSPVKRNQRQLKFRARTFLD
jgi:hypothetical protein